MIAKAETYCMAVDLVLFIVPGMSNPQPVGQLWPRIAVSTAQHKIVNSFKRYAFPPQFLLGNLLFWSMNVVG